MDACYEVKEKLGEGTYGKVYKVVHRDTGALYALKKIKILYTDDGEGVPGTAIREIALLKNCKHQNIIRLEETFIQPNCLLLLFEYADMDLQKYLKRNGKGLEADILRQWTSQLFSGLEFLHCHRMVHRDLKPQNVLVNTKLHVLKLADFGLGRFYDIPLKPYTHEVVTLWYRAPEVLLGQMRYGTPIDVWSLGCIVAEMATATALFPGDSEIDTIFKIFRLLGTPTNEVWPGVTTLVNYKQTYPQWHDTELESVRVCGPELGPDGLEFVRRCLRYNPLDRPSARSAQKHCYIKDSDVLESKIVPPPATRVAACAPAAALAPVGEAYHSHQYYQHAAYGGGQSHATLPQQPHHHQQQKHMQQQQQQMYHPCQQVQPPYPQCHQAQEFGRQPANPSIKHKQVQHQGAASAALNEVGTQAEGSKAAGDGVWVDFVEVKSPREDCMQDHVSGPVLFKI